MRGDEAPELGLRLRAACFGSGATPQAAEGVVAASTVSVPRQQAS